MKSKAVTWKMYLKPKYILFVVAEMWFEFKFEQRTAL